uniref:Uncharacterized protein n=1 Tax=Acrobeloides nanus TaxID=290746 RepID=A0A914CHF7_9BILA
MLLNRKLKILLGIAIGKYMAKNGIVKIAKRNIESVHKDEENLKRKTFPGSKLVYQWKENLISINEILEEIHAHDAIQPSHVTLLLKFVNELTNSAKNFNTVSKEALPIVIAFVETLVPLAHFIVLLDGNS